LIKIKLNVKPDRKKVVLKYILSDRVRYEAKSLSRNNRCKLPHWFSQ